MARPPEDEGALHAEHVAQALQEDMRTCADDEIFLRATQLLAGRGLIADRVHSTITFARQARLLNQLYPLLAEHPTVQLQPQPPWQTMVALASQRVHFFSGLKHLSPQTAGAQTVRLFGDVSCEMVLDGTHLATVQQCASGAELSFVATLKSFLAHA